MVDFFHEFVARIRGQRTIKPRQIVGVWRLKSVNGKHPSAVYIKSHQLQVSPEGTWAFITKLDGHFEGITIKGSGDWKLKHGQLSYRVLNEKRTSAIELHENMLTLSPDISIVSNGKTPIPATYVLD
ncbi:MAG: hypothetical protein NVSMB56_14620 [Pyrinomonadaceae bacterium]